MAITPEEQAKIDKLPENLRAKAREFYEANDNSAGDPDDPPLWEFANPFSAIWTGGDATKLGYTPKPLSKAALDFYNIPKDDLLRFQELAYQAGLYGSSAERGDVPFGARDPDTYKIWLQLNQDATRRYAAGKKQTMWDVLQDLVDNRPENLGKSKKRERQPLITVLPDPRQIEETLLALAPDVIGRDPSPDFISDFTAMYTRMQQEFQENKYALEGTETGGTITAPPSADSIAAFRLRYENPEEYERHRAAEKHIQYVNLLKGIL